jgi:hypothetical protein
MPAISGKCTFAVPETVKGVLPDHQQLLMLHYAKQNLLKKIALIDEQIMNITVRMKKDISDLNTQDL